ncbi:MAG: glycine/sarcosine/betaine reductase complex component C subunit alpha [Firmicutes bacterium]|jgi:hypothetical protein|nr:glycine/sarcosine/betaine reductase complex component C subunit alpha [Bacillota bacterium]MDD4337198.1 glycine/sarcosine/betaine reductase complex component C subunit alpha [Bacillota bacterium]MDD4792614.1 glycine/sarcosine/betaine reductase complex component C subunit alpha [Bacillota bacterium]
MSEDARKRLARLFEELADAVEIGAGLPNLAEGVDGRRTRIGLTVLGSEHGPGEIIDGARSALRSCLDLEVALIGPGKLGKPVKGMPRLCLYPAANETQQHRQMECLLDAGEIDACVTMHYNFPIGVSTVGRVVTPGKGREMFIATTTGTSGTERVGSMIRNAVYGIIAAKASGVVKPTLGVLNIDGARQVERALKKLSDVGYAIDFAESARSGGGAIMRGNDLLMATPDVMICDSLTGNLLMKVLSAASTGGSYESSGYGYGPGIGEGYARIILIVSRASGAPVVASAIRYAFGLVRGGILSVAETEFAAAHKAGWPDLGLLDGGGMHARRVLQQVEEEAQSSGTESLEPPPKKVVTCDIAGVDILQLEAAVGLLWSAGIYAEAGMGCTGPVVMVADEDVRAARKALESGGFL